MNDIISLDSIPLISEEETLKYYMEDADITNYKNQHSPYMKSLIRLILAEENGKIITSSRFEYTYDYVDNMDISFKYGDFICDIKTNIENNENVKYILTIGDNVFETDNINKLINYDNQLPTIALRCQIQLRIISEIISPITITVGYRIYLNRYMRRYIAQNILKWHDKIILDGHMLSTIETDELTYSKAIPSRNPYKKIYDSCMKLIPIQALIINKKNKYSY